MYSMKVKNQLAGAVLCGMLLVTPGYASDLVLAAAPRESVEEAEALYAPVAAYMSKVLGRSVVYKHANHWLRYQNEIKKLKYDIVFDGPHLASWRIKKINHKPLIRVPGDLQFYFLARADDDKVRKVEDLISKKVCVIPPPNLTAVVLLQRLSDPIKEPYIVESKEDMKFLYDRLLKGDCAGTVVRSDFYKGKLGDEDKAKVKIVYTSEKLPNQVFTVSEKISVDERKRLLVAFESDEGKKVMEPLLKRFGPKDAVAFIAAGEHEYDEQIKFLEGVVVGW